MASMVHKADMASPKSTPLIITRPHPFAARSAQRARDMGMDVRLMPLFQAQPLAWSLPDLSAFDALFLSSGQALRLGGPDLKALHGLQTYAVGEATAEAARTHGFTIRGVGDSDGQTLMGEMEAKGIRSILWLCGQEHSVINPALARLHPLPCYQMVPQEAQEDWAKLWAEPAIFTAYSSRAAQRLNQLVPAKRNHLTLIAISQKVADVAGQGWNAIHVAPSPDDAAILAQAAILCHKVGD